MGGSQEGRTQARRGGGTYKGEEDAERKKQGHLLLEAFATASAIAVAVALATATLTALASAVPLDPCPALIPMLALERLQTYPTSLAEYDLIGNVLRSNKQQAAPSIAFKNLLGHTVSLSMCWKD